MAISTTTTNELWLELADESGEHTRIIRVENPDTTTYTTKAAVEEVIGASFFPINNPGSNTTMPFFYDDYDPTIGLTRLKSVQHVQVTKEINNYE